MFQTSASVAARPQHARDLGGAGSGVEPVERLADRDRVGARVRERQRLGRAVERLGAGRDPARATARISASGSTATTRAPVGTSGRVSLPVPAARSTTMRPGREAEPRRERTSTASSGIAGPRALVQLGDRANAYASGWSARRPAL